MTPMPRDAEFKDTEFPAERLPIAEDSTSGVRQPGWPGARLLRDENASAALPFVAAGLAMVLAGFAGFRIVFGAIASLAYRIHVLLALSSLH